MLHETINGFLRQITEDHDKLENQTSAGQIEFLHTIQDRLGKIIDYANQYAEVEASQAKLKALASAIQPEPAPKPPDEKPKYPTYTPQERKLIGQPMGAWSDAKRSAVLELTEIHPDSIQDHGELEENYWTWDEIKHLAKDAALMDTWELQKAFPEHDMDSIVTKATTLGILIKKPTPAKQPAKKNVNPVEACLPDEIRNPSLPVRLRIFRLFSGFTVKQVSKMTGIDKNEIHNYENGKATPTSTVLTKLARAYNMTVQSVMHKAIGEIIPFTESQTIETRTRIARIRAGMSIEVLSAKLFEKSTTTKQYEERFQGEASVRRIADILGVPAWVILTANPETADTPVEAASKTPDAAKNEQPDKTGTPQTTGEKIRAARTAKSISAALMAERVNVPLSTYYKIERSKHRAKDSVLQAIAKELRTPVSELLGPDYEQQPATQANNTTTRKKTEKKPAPTPTNIPSATEQSLQEAITEARLNRNMTQKELSNHSNVPLNHVKDLEAVGLTGTNGYMMRKLCDYLGIDYTRFVAK